MAQLKPGDMAPNFELVDQNGKILHAWYKVSPKDTVPKARGSL